MTADRLIAQGLATAADPLPLASAPSSRPDAPAAARCPACAGAVKPGAAWCTQCWADLRPPPAPEPVPVRLPAQARADGEVPARAGTWQCPPCGAANDLERDDCVACGSALFAGLQREGRPQLVLPGVGDVLRLTRPQRLGLAVAVVLAVLVLVALLGLVTA